MWRYKTTRCRLKKRDRHRCLIFNMTVSLVDRMIESAILKQGNTTRLYKKTLLFNSLKVLIREHPVKFASKMSKNLAEVEIVLKRLLFQKYTTFSLMEKDAKRSDDDEPFNKL